MGRKFLRKSTTLLLYNLLQTLLILFTLSNSQLINVQAENNRINNAQFISQQVPMQMTAGEPYSVSVTMKNIGTTTWTRDGQYKLGSQNPQDNFNWGSNRVF